MTQQLNEKLFIDGESNALFSEPLDSYFAAAGFDPEFDIWCTALWRGYLGTWDICEKRLYLVGLEGRLKDGTDLSVSTYFPRQNDRIFAFWYSGILQVPKGRLIESDLMSYSIYENDLFVTVEKGVVVDSHLRINGISTDPHAEDARLGSSPVAMTFFGKPKSSASPPVPASNDPPAEVSTEEVRDSQDEVEMSLHYGDQGNDDEIAPSTYARAQTHYRLGVTTHHGQTERIDQPKLWPSYQAVAAFARHASVTYGTEIVIKRVKGGWVLPYYLALWNGYIESDEAVNDRENWFQLREEMAEASRRDDELKRSDW